MQQWKLQVGGAIGRSVQSILIYNTFFVINCCIFFANKGFKCSNAANTCKKDVRFFLDFCSVVFVPITHLDRAGSMQRPYFQLSCATKRIQQQSVLCRRHWSQSCLRKIYIVFSPQRRCQLNHRAAIITGSAINL